jgi:hypothetical protein
MVLGSLVARLRVVAYSLLLYHERECHLHRDILHHLVFFTYLFAILQLDGHGTESNGVD